MRVHTTHSIDEVTLGAHDSVQFRQVAGSGYGERFANRVYDGHLVQAPRVNGYLVIDHIDHPDPDSRRMETTRILNITDV